MSASDRSTPSRTFPREARLLNRSDFDRVFARNRRSSDALFTVLAHFNDSGPRRLGITVSKKVSRRAVDRNRIKRIVRDLFRHLDADQPMADYVVIARRPAAERGADEVRDALKRHFGRLARPRSRA